jgi:hypothetical protein
VTSSAFATDHYLATNRLENSVNYNTVPGFGSNVDRRRPVIQARSASEWIRGQGGRSTRWRFVLLKVRIFAPREDFAAQLNPLANWGIGHRNVWRIPNDTAVFGLTGEASARLVFAGSLSYVHAAWLTEG